MNTDDQDLPSGSEKTSGTEEYAMGSGISLRRQGWPERFERWMQLRNWSAQTQATYRTGLNGLLAFLESQGVQEIQRLSLELLERYRLYLFEKRYRGKPLSLATQSVRLTASKAFTRFLRQTNVLLLDVGADLELPKVLRGLPRVLSEDEAMRLVEAPDVSRPAGVRDRAMLEAFYASGARNSELGRLQLPDIDWDQQALWIRQGKGGKDRLVPLGEEALAWLEEYLQRVRPLWARTAGELHVFLTYRGRPMGRDQVAGLVSRWARVAELQGVTPHTLRHSCATHMLRRGAHLRHLQDMLGHESPHTTSQYTQVDLKDLHKALRRYHPREKKWGR